MFLLLPVLALLQILPAPPTPKHLTLAATASAPTAAPGARVSLYLDVTPNPGIHVYAPGAKDYQPIAIKLEKRADATFGRLVYPKSQTMEFEGERIPVYDTKFRLSQDVTLARTVKAGTTLTITGSVTYQACDDQICFIPVTSPVSWIVRVGDKPLL
jgi:DsbC/DsbD-like thiol-disulfide interchange protein